MFVLEFNGRKPQQNAWSALGELAIDLDGPQPTEVLPNSRPKVLMVLDFLLRCVT